MSKNLTRKGLALGAIIALGSSLLAGTPASATGESITLASAFGTGTKTILGSTFELSSTLVGFSTTPGANLKYWVTGVAAADIATSQAASQAALTSPFSSSAAKTDKTTPTGVSIQGATAVLGQYSVLRLGLNTTNVTATTSISVTAFVDDVVADGKITAGEIVSSPVTVTFVKPSEVTATTTLTQPSVATSGGKVDVGVTLGDINLKQVTAGVVRVKITKNGTAAYTTADPTYSTDDAALTYSETTQYGAITSSDIWSAQAYLLDLGTGAQATSTPSETYSKSGVSTSGSASNTGTYEVGVGAITALDSTQVSGTSIRAKLTSAIAFKSQVTIVPTAAANANAPAGVPARVTISGYANLGTTTLTLGGKTISASSEANLVYNTTTDSSGLVNFTITADKAIDGENFTVTVEALDKTSGWVSTAVDAAGTVGSSNAKTFTFKTAKPAKASSSLVGNQVIATTKGGTVSFGVTVYDQFGAPFTSTKGYKVFVTSAAGGTDSGATVSTSAVVENGKATVSYVDNSTTNGSVTLTLSLKEYNSSTGLYDTNLLNYAGGSVTDPGTIAVYTVSSTTVSTLTGTNSSSSPAVEYVDFKAVDTRTGASAPALATTAQTIAGKALAADGSAIPGAQVTITTSGLQFVAGTTYGIGSITTQTDSSGNYSVTYYSQKSGKQSLVITSGSATKTVDSSTFAAPVHGKEAKVVITGLSALIPGRSSVYTVTVTDKFGNAIEDATSNVSVSYTGPGYFSTDLSAITHVGSKGTLTLTLLAGANDIGAGTLTVTSYGADNANSTDAEKRDSVVATQAIAIANVDTSVAARLAASTKKFYVSVDNAKGDKVVVKVAGKTVKSFVASLTKQTVVIKATKGKKSVKVYVDGDLVVAKTLTIK